MQATSYSCMPNREVMWEETMRSLEMQLTVEFLSIMQEALGLVTSNDETDVVIYVQNSSTWGWRQEITSLRYIVSSRPPWAMRSCLKKGQGESLDSPLESETCVL